MPLTPADVYNVTFSKSSIGTQGCKEDEVDVFLDAQRMLREARTKSEQLLSNFLAFEFGKVGGRRASELFADVTEKAERFGRRFTLHA